MKISSNQFTRKSFNKGSGTWTNQVTPSGGSFTKKVFNKGTNSWEGPNTSESAYGMDDPFGGPDSTYGTTPYGGLAHFKLRQNYSITR